MNRNSVTSSLKNKDALVKAGMIASMGLTAYSGFSGMRIARLIHPWAGVAVLVFSLWHHQINTRKQSQAIRNGRKQ